MADENITTTPPPAPSAAIAPQPAATAIPPEYLAMIEAAKSSAYNAGAKEARVATEARFAKQAAAPSAPAATRTDAPDAMAILELRDAFDDAAGDLSLKASQRKLLRTSVMRDRPVDVGAYVASFVADAGWLATPVAPSAPQPAAVIPTAPPAPTQPITAPPGAPPVTDRSPPPPTYTVTDSTPLLRMRESDRQAVLARYVAELGFQKGNDKFAERYLDELNRDNVRVGARR